MGTATKGHTAEAAVLNAFVERGLCVLVPFGDGQPYDLIVHLSSQAFLRVQCKTARRRNNCLVFNSRTTDHGRGRLPYLGLADVFGVYAPSQAIYLVPVRDVSSFIRRLRLEPARNNQQRGIRLAANYKFDRWTAEALCEVVRASTFYPEIQTDPAELELRSPT